MPKLLQPQSAVPTWNSMSPGEKLAWLLDKALDCKREILTLPMPDPNDDSIEAHRIRMLILAAADSTIEQTIRLQTNPPPMTTWKRFSRKEWPPPSWKSNASTPGRTNMATARHPSRTRARR
jgi:hypothetical protein